MMQSPLVAMICIQAQPEASADSAMAPAAVPPVQAAAQVAAAQGTFDVGALESSTALGCSGEQLGQLDSGNAGDACSSGSTGSCSKSSSSNQHCQYQDPDQKSQVPVPSKKKMMIKNAPLVRSQAASSCSATASQDVVCPVELQRQACSQLRVADVQGSSWSCPWTGLHGMLCPCGHCRRQSRASSDQAAGVASARVEVRKIRNAPLLRTGEAERAAPKPAGKQDSVVGQPCREAGSGHGMRSGPSERSDESTRASESDEESHI